MLCNWKDFFLIFFVWDSCYDGSSWLASQKLKKCLKFHTSLKECCMNGEQNEREERRESSNPLFHQSYRARFISRLQCLSAWFSNHTARQTFKDEEFQSKRGGLAVFANNKSWTCYCVILSLVMMVIQWALHTSSRSGVCTLYKPKSNFCPHEKLQKNPQKRIFFL